MKWFYIFIMLSIVCVTVYKGCCFYKKYKNRRYFYYVSIDCFKDGNLYSKKSKTINMGNKILSEGGYDELYEALVKNLDVEEGSFHINSLNYLGVSYKN